MSAPQPPEPSESASNDQKPRRVTRAGTTSGNCALTRKTAICCRVTGVAGTEVAAAAAAGDSPPGELLDKRTEQAASRHVVERLLARHAGGGLENTQGLGQG